MFTDGNDGLITATIIDGTNYVRSNTAAENETSVIILDALPVISISAPAMVTETDANSTFNVTLTIETASFIPLTGRPLVIDGLTIANTSDPLFQDYYQSHTSPIQFTNANDSTDRDITVPVTIIGDDYYKNWGEISITLASGDEYTADPNNNSAKVSIREDEPADVSIAIDTPTSVVEGENIVVKLIATNSSTNAVNNLMVDFQVADVTGTYLNYTNAKVSINATTGSPPAEVEVTIPTSEVQNSSEGTISLVVLRGNRYETASSTPATVTVMAKEDIVIPVVSIETRYERVSDTDYIEYTLSAIGITSDITVRLNVVTDGDNVVNSGKSDLTGLRLTSAVSSLTGTIRFSTGNSGDSLVEIGITMNNTYTINQSKSQIAFRVDDGEFDPAVSIIGDGTVSEGADAVFTVSTDEADASGRSRALEVALMVSEGSTNFISGTPTQTVTIPSDETSVKYHVSTTSDGSAGSNPGTITVEVKPGGYYKLAASNTSATVTVLDDGGELPTINVAAATGKEKVMEGQNVEFTFTSSPALTNTLDLKILLNDPGNFLNTGVAEKEYNNFKCRGISYRTIYG